MLEYLAPFLIGAVVGRLIFYFIRKYDRFWFICWGTKAVRQEVTTRNPYSRIIYTEYLELKRRKKR